MHRYHLRFIPEVRQTSQTALRNTHTLPQCRSCEKYCRRDKLIAVHLRYLVCIDITPCKFESAAALIRLYDKHARKREESILLFHPSEHNNFIFYTKTI
jgi:hypothetical protein